MVKRRFTPKPSYDAVKLVEDMARKGWSPAQLAQETGLCKATISYFLTGTTQTPKTAKRISAALGRSPGYYLISSRQRAVA